MLKGFLTFNWSKLPSLICVVALVLILTSCLDDDDQAAEPLPVAYVSIFHESPDAPSLDVYVDGRTVNRLEFTDYTGYLNFYTGDRNFKISSFNASNSLVDTTVNFTDGGFYSVFIVNNLSNVETLAVRDSSNAPAPGKAKIRFINLSPDAPNLDVALDDGTSNLFTGQAFKTPSDFIEVDATSSAFIVRAAGETEELVSIPDIDMQEGKFYTIIARGFISPPSGNSNLLSIEIIKN